MSHGANGLQRSLSEPPATGDGNPQHERKESQHDPLKSRESLVDILRWKAEFYHNWIATNNQLLTKS